MVDTIPTDAQTSRTITNSESSMMLDLLNYDMHRTTRSAIDRCPRAALSRSPSALLILAALMIANLDSSNTVQAGLITFRYEATIDSIDGSFDPSGFFELGDTVSGSYTFESTTSDDSADADSGNYFGITAFDFTVGNYSGSVDKGLIALFFDGVSSEGYYVTSNQTPVAPPIDGRSVLFFELALESFDLTGPGVFTSDVLPLTPPEINAFSRRQFVIGFDGGTRVVSSLTSLSSTHSVVPEPSSCAIFSIGVFGLLLRHRRRSTEKFQPKKAERSFASA